MNHTTRRAFTLYVLVAAFFAGMAIFVVTLFINGGNWAANRANKHVYSAGQIVSAGSIYARGGEVLAKSVNGKRIYSDDKTLRMATLHAVGDAAGFIASGVHSAYKKELSGYSFVNGVYLLKEYGKGSDIYLTLDAKACAAAYNALGTSKGTIGVYNYKTGEILCMVSTPAYDINNKPKNMAAGPDEKYEGVYLNRFLTGMYTPGSIFKVVTAAGAIENIPDIYTRTFTCTGELQTDNGVVSCPSVHGEVNFEKALNNSCNVAFAQIAIELGNDKMTLQANALGFNRSMTVNRMETAKSTFDLSAANDLDLGWAGIGQYNTLVNPCHMITLMGAIANGGQGIVPYSVDRIVSPDKTVTQRGSAQVAPGITLSSATAGKLAEMLRSNVVNNYGDGGFPNLQMCGKTGTAEVGEGKVPHAWFVGFSLRDDMPFAVVTIVENGRTGLNRAIPAANKVLQTLAPK